MPRDAALPQSQWNAFASRRRDPVTKREAVLETAAQLFLEKSYGRTSLNDVAERLKITKPAGRHLSVAACDLTLHYFYGEDTEATPCEGISTITETREVERPMKLPTVSGPGFVKMTTGVKATQASVVYMDAVFAYVEPGVRECWICVAQPATTTPYVCPSPAWSNVQ